MPLSRMEPLFFGSSALSRVTIPTELLRLMEVSLTRNSCYNSCQNLSCSVLFSENTNPKTNWLRLLFCMNMKSGLSH
jgi:hypothetical protein